MSAVDIATSVFRVFTELAPIAGKALAAGTTEDALLQSLTLGVEGAREAAAARVESRAGGPVVPLAVEAVHLCDAAARLRILGRPGDARILEDLAGQLRRDARSADDTL